MKYDYYQTIRNKQSLLASTRNYSETPLQSFSFVQEFASLVQIYKFFFKSIQMLLCKSEHNKFTLLQLEKVYTTQINSNSIV